MKRVAIALLCALPGLLLAAEATPELPPAAVVARVLADNPLIQAAGTQVQIEEANRRRLEAGAYEWNVRLGGQQRRTKPTGTPEERFSEWNAALERQLRLPGKASIDAELGASGVALAETLQGDARHEASRALLKAWFTWLKENAALRQWTAQVALLEKQARAVQRRHQLGDAARLDAIQGEAALAQARAQQTQADLRQQTAAEELRRRFPGLPVVEPVKLGEPQAVGGSVETWVGEILEHSHELGIARREARRARMLAGRSSRDTLPDPTLGVHVSRERGGEEQVVGAYVSIPLPGGARRASADAALAQADAMAHREAAAVQKVTVEAAALYHAASAAYPAWQGGHEAAERFGLAADLTARAYQLGEGSLSEVLQVRRLANEAQLAARLLQLDAIELRYRLLLDAHRLWDLDGDHGSE